MKILTNEVSQFLSFVFRRRHRVLLGIVLYRHLHACTCIIVYVHVRKQPFDRDFFMYSITCIMLRVLLYDTCMLASLAYRSS
jgi:hydrogenase-4 membrane subunit HyfE